MEIPNINVPEIYIPEPYIPEIYKPDITPVTQYLNINTPGCTYQHRDIKNTGNHNLLLDDPNGVYTICDFSFPSFIPPVFNPNQMTIVEELPAPESIEPYIPETETPKIPEEKESSFSKAIKVLPVLVGPSIASKFSSSLSIYLGSFRYYFI